MYQRVSRHEGAMKQQPNWKTIIDEPLVWGACQPANQRPTVSFRPLEAITATSGNS